MSKTQANVMGPVQAGRVLCSLLAAGVVPVCAGTGAADLAGKARPALVEETALRSARRLWKLAITPSAAPGRNRRLFPSWVPVDPERKVRSLLKAHQIALNKPAPRTSVGRLRPTTIQGLVALRHQVRFPLVVTGGNEPGHASGNYSHGKGYKVDLRLTPKLGEFIKRVCVYIGKRSDRALLWLHPSGWVFAREPDHWDVTFANTASNIACRPVPARLVASRRKPLVAARPAPAVQTALLHPTVPFLGDMLLTPQHGAGNRQQPEDTAAPQDTEAGAHGCACSY
jgi:hypothetical protein